MNTPSFAAVSLVALSLLSAGSAFAGEADFEVPTSYASSTVSRGEVKAEALRARLAGLIAQGEHTVLAPETGAMLSRAQVRAEALEAIRVGAVSRGDETVIVTEAQLQSIRLAGQQAQRLLMASL